MTYISSMLEKSDSRNKTSSLEHWVWLNSELRVVNSLITFTSETTIYTTQILDIFYCPRRSLKFLNSFTRWLKVFLDYFTFVFARQYLTVYQSLAISFDSFHYPYSNVSHRLNLIWSNLIINGRKQNKGISQPFYKTSLISELCIFRRVARN